MPNNYFDKLIKKVGDTLNTYYCMDSDARTAIANLEADISTIENAIDDQWNIGQSPVLYVSKENSRFTTINQAITYARTYLPSMTGRVTIVISGGTYEEYIDLDDNPGIDFFGLAGVTVRSSVAWRLSTLRCSNSIKVVNMGFENYYTPGDEEHAGYALHADPVTGSQIYTNCTFYSDNNAAIGVGMGNNGQVNFNYCSFRGSPGGIYAHNNATSNTSGQWLRFFNCRFEDHNNGNCIRIDDACSMQGGSGSVMGIVFNNCYGNNGGITYRYGNPVSSLSYIPANSSDYDVFLYSLSSNNSIIGIDPVKQTKTIELIFGVCGDNEWFFPETDAYKYNWSISRCRYHEYSGGSWSALEDYTGGKTIEIVKEKPDSIRVFIPGNNTLAPGSRVFDIVLEGVPRKTYSFPESIT